MKGQLNVLRTGTVYRGQAQCIADRHNVSRTGTAYRGQAQRNEDRHSVSRTSTACLGQAQRIEDKHSVSRTGTAYRGQALQLLSLQYCSSTVQQALSHESSWEIYAPFWSHFQNLFGVVQNRVSSVFLP